MTTVQRDLVWERLDEPGLEHLRLHTGPDGITATSVVVTDGARLHYELHCDAGWQFREATIGMAGRSLHLEHDPGAGWLVDGVARPDLAACIDLDIMATPFTNTLPLRRLTFATGVPQLLWMAYVQVPELTVAPQQQEYTRLDDQLPSRFRYHGVGTGFVAEITVDPEAIVTDYPGLWRLR